MKPGDSIIVGVNSKGLVCAPVLKAGVSLFNYNAIAYSPSFGDALIVAKLLGGFTLTEKEVEKYRRLYETIYQIDSYIGCTVKWIHKTYWQLANKTATVSKPIVVAKREPGMPYIDGACCAKCNTFTVYAEPGFTCYSCRSDKFRSVFRSTD